MSRKHIAFVGLLTAFVFVAFSPIPALVAQAQEATTTTVVEPSTAPTTAAATSTPTQPEETATVVINQDVSIPYGQWIEDLGDIAKSWLIPTVLGMLTYVTGKYVPLPLRGIANNILRREAEQLLEKAIEYGINATAGAERDKTLTVDVGNEVLRKALNYALSNGWVKLIDFLDGPDGILQKLFARLDIPIESNADSFKVPPAAPTAAKMATVNKAAAKSGKPTVQATSWVMQK